MEISLLPAARRLVKGIRTGNAGMAAVGAAMAALALIKATSSPKRELVYVAKVRRGEEVRIAVVEPELS